MGWFHEKLFARWKSVLLISFCELCFYFKELHFILPINEVQENHYWATLLVELKQGSCKRKMLWDFLHLHLLTERKSSQTEVTWNTRGTGGLQRQTEPKGAVFRGGQAAHAGTFGCGMSINYFVAISWFHWHHCQNPQLCVKVELHPDL